MMMMMMMQTNIVLIELSFNPHLSVDLPHAPFTLTPCSIDLCVGESGGQQDWHIETENMPEICASRNPTAAV